MVRLTLSSLMLFFILLQVCYSEILKQDEFFYKEPSIRLFLNLCGTTFQLNGDSVVVTVDQDNVVASIHRALKLKGLIYSNDTNYENLSSKPIQTSLIAGLQAISVIVPVIYRDHSKLDKINFIVYLIHPNAYGRNTKDLFFTFDMNKKLNNKIVWDKFNMRNAFSIFPNFQITKSFWLENFLT